MLALPLLFTLVMAGPPEKGACAMHGEHDHKHHHAHPIARSAVAGAVGAVAIPAGMLWGAAMGGVAGVGLSRAALGENPKAELAPFSLVYVGMGAALGALVGVVPGVLAAVGTDLVVWLWQGQRQGATPWHTLVSDLPLLGAVGVVTVVAAAAAGVMILLRAPNGGPRRDPVGTLAFAGGAAGLVMLLGLPVLGAGVVARGFLLHRLTHTPE